VVDANDAPLHVNTLAAFAGFAVSVTVPPLQMYPLLVGAADGVGLTVTCVVYTVEGLHPDPAVPLVTVKE